MTTKKLDFSSINDRLKIISEKRLHRKIFNKDIANQLNITPANYSTMLSRESIPFHQIIIYAKAYYLSLDYILWGEYKIKVKK
jgi:hypothetical protein